MLNYDDMTFEQRLDLDVFLVRMKPYARQEIAQLEGWLRDMSGTVSEILRRDLNETKARFELIYGESYENYSERMRRNG